MQSECQNEKKVANRKKFNGIEAVVKVVIIVAKSVYDS
jgi:hypothetical protein